MEHRDLMLLADAYANASFEQGLQQRTDDPAPEKARERLVAAINAEVQRSVAEERERCALVAEGFAQTRDWVPGSLYDTLRREIAARIRRA